MSPCLSPQLEALLPEPFPPQRAFRYSKEKWKSWFSGMPEVIEAIDNLPSALDRTSVAQAFESLWPNNVAGAFVAAMIWGHGPTGYGPYRTASQLSQSDDPKGAELDPSVVDRLKTSVEIVRKDGPVAGYEYLNNRPGKIAGLGPSFFTKWLSFASVTGSQGVAGAAPILDELVIVWFAELEPSIRLRYGHTPDYKQYVELLTECGQKYDLAPVEVEERIFRLIRDDGVDEDA